MKTAGFLMPTLREVPGEAEIISHQLMLRAGLMRKIATGIYMYLPLGLKTLQRVEQIIREEMDRAGAQELLMSALLPSEVYQQSGRWDIFGQEMFRLSDRNSRDFCLGPTHEELFTDAVKQSVSSYKQLPCTLYQIQTKYRDERRPRFGVMRSREFIMKDAYSFDKNWEGLDLSYQKMYKAYCNIFDRLELDYMVVDADSGAMGGSGSQEFMVKSEVGEDSLAYCDGCKYAANVEKAAAVPQIVPTQANGEPEMVATPDVKTIPQLTEFFGLAPQCFGKTMVYLADGKMVAVMVRGDRQINETKLTNALNCTNLELAPPESLDMFGYIGPLGLDMPLYVDKEVMMLENIVIGANKIGFHYKNVNPKQDFKPTAVLDLRMIEEGDVCPKCGGKITITQGIEVGHIFKLGTKYSDALNLTILDENGKLSPVIMGCYGIGVNRCIAAVIEQHHDENGIKFPKSIAPFDVAIVPVKVDNPVQYELAEKIYQDLLKSGKRPLLDNRDERAGVKFKDMDLIGIPLRITVGKQANEGIVEFKQRGEKTAISVDVEEVTKLING